MTLTEKLSPQNVRVSGKFTAILACILGERWSNPAIAGLTATSDGFLMARTEGDIGYNEILGTVSDLERNLQGVARVVKLTKKERAELARLTAKALGGDA